MTLNTQANIRRIRLTQRVGQQQTSSAARAGHRQGWHPNPAQGHVRSAKDRRSGDDQATVGRKASQAAAATGRGLRRFARNPRPLAKGQPSMSASNRSVIQKACRSILADRPTTPSDLLKATTILWRLEASAKKGRPRGRPFQRRQPRRKAAHQRLEHSDDDSIAVLTVERVKQVAEVLAVAAHRQFVRSNED